MFKIELVANFELCKIMFFLYFAVMESIKLIYSQFSLQTHFPICSLAIFAGHVEIAMSMDWACAFQE